MGELEKVDARVRRDVGCRPKKPASSGRGAIDVRGNRVELGHVLIGTGHKLDLHALPCLAGGGIPLDQQRRPFVGRAGRKRRWSGSCSGRARLSFSVAGHGSDGRDTGQGKNGPGSKRSKRELHFDVAVDGAKVTDAGNAIARRLSRIRNERRREKRGRASL